MSGEIARPSAPATRRNRLCPLALGSLLCALGFAPAPAQDAAPPTPPAPDPNQPVAPSTLATPAPGDNRETELLLRDRRRITGRLVEVTARSVVIAIGGIPTTFPIEQIESVRVLPSVEERYAQLRAAINDEDVEGIMRLAEWLRQRERYTLALKEADRVLTLEPRNRQANELRTLIVEQQKIAASSLAPGDDLAEPGPAIPGPRPRPLPQRRPQDDFPLLDDDQINLIRVFETDLRDPPRMIIDRETVDAFLDRYGGVVVEDRGLVPVSPEGKEQFYTMRPADLLSWFFDVRARDLYPRVRVQENPRSMSLFRDNIQRTWLTNSCATAKCHAGPDAGRLYLYNKRPNSDRSAYTNFLILDRYRTADGLTLIDVREPRRSILLQMGLPRDRAIVKHPEVISFRRHWAPVFDSEADARFRQAVEWIQSLYPNRSDYPIDYLPPTPAAAPPAAPDNAQPPPPR